MGLAGPRKRTKIGHDPNNTTWARDDTNYGSKILRAQGWTPGSYLGAKDAAHTSHLTAASASHIRVALREDNLGLGAKYGADPTQNFGLSGFQSLLGRLNGKSDVQLSNEKRVASMLRLEQKYQQMGFVKAGYLMGETIDKEQQDADISASSVEKQQDVAKEKKRKMEQKGGKAKANSDHKSAGETPEPQSDDQISKRKKANKPKDSESKEERRRRKLEKRASKEARRKAKSLSNTPTEIDSPGYSVTPTDGGSSSEQPERSAQRSASGGRHASRQRFIRQKRMSGMDPKALREILMIKS